MTTSVFVNDVRVPERHRSLVPERVKSIAGSFEDIGQQMPITFYWDGDTPVLIAGRHRLEAARSLDWEHIEAVEMEVDPLTQELWEIDENLMRADLTVMERADHTNRRADIVKKRAESLIPQNEEKPAHRPSRGQGDFVKDTAAKTGRSKASVERDKRRGKKITPETMKAIKDTPAAKKGVELDALADMTPDQQKEAVKMVKSGKARFFRIARDGFEREELEQLATNLAALVQKAIKDDPDNSQIIESFRKGCIDRKLVKKLIAGLKVDAEGLSKLATLYYETAGRSTFGGDMQVVVKALRMVKAQKIAISEAVNELALPFIEKNDKDAEWEAVEERISEKITYSRGCRDGPGDAPRHFQGNLPSHILKLDLSDDDLVPLCHFFWAACNIERVKRGEDRVGCLHSLNATTLVNKALDVMAANKLSVAKAIEQVSTPEIKKWRTEQKKEDKREADEADRPWQERDPFEFFAEFIIGLTNYASHHPTDYTEVDILRRHTKNCGLTKLEAAVEKHLAETEAKDAA